MPMWARRLPIAEAVVSSSFFLAAVSAIIFSRHTGEATLVWPSTAIAAALWVRLSPARGVLAIGGLMLAGICANQLATDDPVTTAASLTSVDVAEILLTVWLVRYKFGPRFSLPTVSVEKAVWMFVLLALAIPALGSVLGGWVVHVAFGDGYRSSVASWGLSSAYGACIFAPLIYLYSPLSLQRLIAPRFRIVNVLLFALALIVTYLSIRYVRFPFVTIGSFLIVASFTLGGFGTACLTTVAGMLVIGMWITGIQPHGLGAHDVAQGLSSLPFVALVATMVVPIGVGLSNDERRRALRQVSASERRFRESIECAPIGMALVELSGSRMTTNAAFTQMLGYAESDARSFELGQILHPEEREQALLQMQRLLLREIDRYDAERRYAHKNGGWVWVRVVVSLVSDEDGNPAHFFAQIESLQALRRAEASLFDERNRLQTTMHAISDAVITTDVTGCITFVNEAAQKIIGQTFAQVIGRRSAEIVLLTDPRTGKSIPSMFSRCVTRLESVGRSEPCLLHRPDGSVGYILDTVSPVIDATGHFSGAVIVLRDATKIQAQASDLSRRATQDPLTHLANRFEFERRAQTCFERARLLERPAVLLMMDLDRFKQVNDQGGHAAGDAMLLAVAKTLQTEVRDSDTVARLGGDEFAILLDGCRIDQAEVVSMKILRAVQAIKLVWNDAQFSIGASMGAAPFAVEYSSLAVWLAAADAACYESKQHGRGQLRIAAVGQPAGTQTG